MEKRRLIIVGDSSFAEVACEMFHAEGRYEVVGFAVHEKYRARDQLLGRPVHAIEALPSCCPPADQDAFVALTYRELNRTRARIVAEIKAMGYKLATYISPAAFVWPNVVIGENCFIFENNVIQPFCRIGNNVVLWSGNHIGHHSAVDDNVFISSHVVVSGHVTIGRNCFIGVNATIADRVVVADDNWIGPNALITKDTESAGMYRAESTSKSAVSSLRFFKIRRD